MNRTASVSPQRNATRAAHHEHGWIIESRHATSAGYVLYVRCDICLARRVDLQQHPEDPPAALSNALPAVTAAAAGLQTLQP